MWPPPGLTSRYPASAATFSPAWTTRSPPGPTIPGLGGRADGPAKETGLQKPFAGGGQSKCLFSAVEVGEVEERYLATPTGGSRRLLDNPFVPKLPTGLGECVGVYHRGEADEGVQPR